MIRQHIWENAKLRLSNLSGRMVERYQKGVKDGFYPELIGTTPDMGEDKFIQMFACPEDLGIVVTGDPGRDHVLVVSENGFMAPPTSRRINLPKNWDELRKAK